MTAAGPSAKPEPNLSAYLTCCNRTVSERRRHAKRRANVNKSAREQRQASGGKMEVGGGGGGGRGSGEGGEGAERCVRK